MAVFVRVMVNEVLKYFVVDFVKEFGLIVGEMVPISAMVVDLYWFVGSIPM